jgi:uncharacterized DUF497 family protein
VQFEWDRAKAGTNLRKHRVSFHEAATVLLDPLSTTFPDPASEGEQRFVTIRVSAMGRLLVVAHTDRGDTIRLISARRATRRERSFYEQT